MDSVPVALFHALAINFSVVPSENQFPDAGLAFFEAKAVPEFTKTGRVLPTPNSSQHKHIVPVDVDVIARRGYPPGSRSVALCGFGISTAVIIVGPLSRVQ